MIGEPPGQSIAAARPGRVNDHTSRPSVDVRIRQSALPWRASDRATPRQTTLLSRVKRAHGARPVTGGCAKPQVVFEPVARRLMDDDRRAAVSRAGAATRPVAKRSARDSPQAYAIITCNRGNLARIESVSTQRSQFVRDGLLGGSLFLSPLTLAQVPTCRSKAERSEVAQTLPPRGDAESSADAVLAEGVSA